MPISINQVSRYVERQVDSFERGSIDRWNQSFSPLDSRQGVLWQVVKRVVTIAFLFFSRALASPFYFTAKLCLAVSSIHSSSSPSSRRTGKPTFLEVVDPLVDSEKPLLFFPQNANFSIPEAFTSDLWIYMASFLGARDLFKLCKVSKTMHRIFQATDKLWNSIWRPLLKIPPEQPSLGLKNPKEQLKAYFSLLQEGAVGYFGDLFSRIATHMPGGPIAFQNLPYHQIIGYLAFCWQKARDVPVIRGKIVSEELLSEISHEVFLAMRIQDREEKEGKVAVLAFFCKKYKTQPSPSSWKEVYYQPSNPYWRKNELIQQAPQDIQLLEEYILAILRREDLTQREEFSKYPFNNQIKLV